MKYDDIVRIVELTNSISFLPGWKLNFRPGVMDSWIQWVWTDEDHIHGGEFECKGRKWRISEYMTDSEFVQTAFAAAKMCLEHEAREAFKFHGRPVMRPHFDVYKLMELCDLGAVSKRTEATPT